MTAITPVPVVALVTANVEVPYTVETVKISPTEYPVPVLTTVALTAVKTRAPVELVPDSVLGAAIDKVVYAAL